MSENFFDRVYNVVKRIPYGKVTTYASLAMVDKGVLFVTPGTMVYKGMIVGERNNDGDLVVNITMIQQHMMILNASSLLLLHMKLLLFFVDYNAMSVVQLFLTLV